MGTINAKRTRSRKSPEPHKNWMGGTSFDVSPVLRLKMAAASCFFGEPQYYHRDSKDKRPRKRPPLSPQSRLTDEQLTKLRSTLTALDPKDWRSLGPAEMLEKAIDSALDADAEATMRFAAELRQDLNIRTTPQVIMVRAAKHPKVKGTDLLARYGGQVMNRLDEPTVQMAYHLSKYGKPIPSNLKRAWARRLERAKAFELAKYRMEGREVSLYDVVNVCHPASDLVSSFMKGKVKQTGKNETWESKRSKAGKVKDAKEAKKVWTDASKSMGHMALLRNLRNLEQSGALTKDHLKQLVEGVEKGRQLPFRYYAAYNALSSGRGMVRDAIEECMEVAFQHSPKFEGRVMSLSDNSGSAHGTLTSSMGTMTVAQIGNLMAVMTAKMADEGHVGIFGDRYATWEVRKKTSIFSELEKAEAVGRGIGGATEHGMWTFWRKAIEEKQHWDHVFVYSDMQAGHGGLYGVGGDMGWCPIWAGTGYGRHIDVPALISQYRSKVNPKVNVYLVQTAGYQDTLVPEFYDRTYILGGWSEHVLRFADYMSQLRQ